MADKTLAIHIKTTEDAVAVFQKVGDASKSTADTIDGAAKKSTASLKDLKSEINTVGTSWSAVGLAGVGFFSWATSSSMEFTAAMSNVNSIARVSDAELGALRSTILDLASSYGAAPTDLADGLYNIIGSGYEANDAVQILTASVVAANAGLTDTETAATAVTAVLNAYSMSADQAGNVSDILFKIVDSGVISFETLAGAMGRTLPLASSLGVSLEELGAGYAALTRIGYSGDMAETGIAALMTAAIGPTDALKEAVKAYGYESTEALINAEGFTGFLQLLQTASGGSSEKMLALTGNTRANGAALALAAYDGQTYVAMLDDMNSAARDGEYTLEVFGIQMDNAAGSVKKAAAEFDVFKINVGSSLEPLVAFAADGASTVLGAFGALPDYLQEAVVWFGAGTSATLAFAGGFMLLVPRIVETRAALQTLAAAGGPVGTLGRMIPALFGPAGIAIGAVTLAATIGISAWNRHKASVAETAAAYAALESEAKSVDDRISSLKLTDDVATAFKLQGLVDSTRAAGGAWTTELEAMEADWNEFLDSLGTESVDMDILNSPLFDNVLQKMVDAGTIRQDQMEAMLAGDADMILNHATQIRNAMGEYANAYNPTASDMALIEGNMGELMDLITNQNIDGMKVMEDWAAARKQYLEGDHPDYQSFDAWWEQYKKDVIEGTALTVSFGQVVSGVGASVAAAIREPIDAAIEAKDAYEEYLETVREGLSDLLKFAGLDDPLSQWNLSGHATEASTLADSIGDINAAMDANYRIIVSNTDALAKNMQGIDDWATGLIGVRGEYAEIDKLYAEGRISLEKYNEAQVAQEQIMVANASVQRDVLAIQAALSPIVAQNADEYANYIQQLREMNDGIDDAADGAQQQMAALGWLDQSTAGRVQQFLELGQSMDELDESGRAAFETMVNGLATTDPMFMAVLASAGLVKQELDGSWSVNWEGLNGADSDIARLTESIDALIVTLGGVPPSVSTEVTVEDNASGPIQEILNLIWSLPDHTTTVVQTVLETHYRSTGSSGVLPFAHGGSLPAFASGGVPFWAGEHGAEIAHFANGGTALIPTEGMYSAPPGTYISPSNAVSNAYGGDTYNITVNGADAELVRNVFMNEIIPAWKYSNQQYRSGAGGAV